MTDSTDLQQRIEDAARRRAEVIRARNTVQARSRVTGYQKQLQKARAERQRALAQRIAEEASDESPVGEDQVARLQPTPIRLEEAPDEIGATSAAQAFPQASPVPRATPQAGAQDLADAPALSAGRVATLGKFSVGLTAGLTASVVVMVVASSVNREISGEFEGGARIPDVAVNLTDLMTPTAPLASVALPAGRDDRSAEVVARGAMNPLASPSHLSDATELVALPRQATAPVAAMETLFARLATPPVQETTQYGPQSERLVWALPALGAMRADLPPAMADPTPSIDGIAATPDYSDIEIALSSPSPGPEHDTPVGIATDVEPAEPVREIRMAALQATAGADVVPDVARGARIDASSVQMHAPALTASPDLIAAFDVPPADISTPPRASALPQTLPGVGSTPAREFDPERTQPVRPASLSVLQPVQVSVPGAAGSAVALPDEDRALERSTHVAALREPGPEARFDRTAVAPAPAPRMNVRAVFTLSRESALDADWLNRIGVDLADVQITPFPVSRTRVYFFHMEDARDAKELATHLGGDVVDMTSVVPSPPRGLVEVQLSD